MLRKLLLLCLTLFAFTTAVNAQEHIVGADVGCVNNVREFVQIADVNSKEAFRILVNGTDALTSWATTNYPLVALNSAPAEISWSTANGQWEFNQGSTLVFVNSSTVGDPLVPANGWIGAGGAGCDPADTFSLVSENNSVLPVDKEIYSKMALYPNPSNGFINISNLDASSRVIITNITGQIVKDVKVDINNNRIDIQELSKGFYFVEIEGKKTIKLIKQ